MAARKKRTPRITIGEHDVIEQVKHAVAKILKSDYAEFRTPLHTDKEIRVAVDGVGDALVRAFVKASPKLFDGSSRTSRVSKGRAAGSNFAVMPGVYRRIEVRLNKVAPGEFTITFKKWVAGAGRNAENVGKISKPFKGSASDARAYANKIGAEAASEYPNYLVEVVT